jgi:hydrogenase/urease accessory protein HupE
VRVPVLVAALLLGVPLGTAAHDLARSHSSLEIRGPVVEGWHLFDLLAFRGADADGNGTVSYEELDAALPAVYDTLKAHLLVRGPEAPTRTEVRSYAIVQDGHIVRLDMVYTFDRPVTALEVVSKLPLVLKPEHLHFVSVRSASGVKEAVLDARQPSATFSSTESPRALPTVRRFLVLGIEHILTGYDHLAFLMSLLIVTTTARSLIGIVTSFTIAHSVTLALATFGLVVLPSRFVETVIALSIAYVAIENLLHTRTMERYRITFLFGLLHGFGFSNLLREMELPRRELALSLFSFNAGVEIGQVVFVLAVYPLVKWVATKRWPTLRPVVSGAVLCVAVYWFIQRAFIG